MTPMPPHAGAPSEEPVTTEAGPLGLGEDIVGEPAPTVRVRLDLAYDGGPFSGWARQPGLVTVEGCLTEAAELVLREPVRLTVAGRTDAGVHAAHQVVHLDVSRARWEALPGRSGDSPETALVRRLGGALHRVLGAVAEPLRPGAHPAAMGAILVRRAERVDRSFDARFSALGRSYAYRIADGPEHQSPLARTWTWTYPYALDPAALTEAGQRLLGLHDFLSFCRPRPGATTVRELRRVEFFRTASGLVEARVEADAFCHHMVRAVVGACAAVASGQRDPAWLEDMLARPLRDSGLRLAPPEGLSLERIDYPAAQDWSVQARRTRARRVQP